MKRRPLPPPDKPLGEPIHKFEDTFSAEDLILEHFFGKKSENSPETK